MPTPIVKGDAATWKLQRGGRSGTTPEGKDWIELVYRGPAGDAMAAWRGSLIVGSTQPDTSAAAGFGHCKLVTLPATTDDGRAYFATATLRFEGPGGDADDDEDPIGAVSTWYSEAAEIGIDTGDGINFYSYERGVVTINYIRTSYPTAYRFQSKRSKLPNPKDTLAWSSVSTTATIRRDVELSGGQVVGPDVQVMSDETGSSFPHVVQRGDGSYEVTERHTKYLLPTVA